MSTPPWGVQRREGYVVIPKGEPEKGLKRSRISTPCDHPNEYPLYRSECLSGIEKGDLYLWVRASWLEGYRISLPCALAYGMVQKEKTFYRAEGPHSDPGYAGSADERTGRYFGTLMKAMKYLSEDRHLYEVELEDGEVVSGNPEDHVLLSPEQAARKVHSDLCPNHREVSRG